MSVLMIGSQIRPSQENRATAVMATFGTVAVYSASQGSLRDAAIVAMSGASIATIVNACENPTFENKSLAVVTYIASYIAARLIK